MDWLSLVKMIMVNTHEAKTHLSRLLDQAAAGEDIVIAKAGLPVARLVRYEVTHSPRRLGLLSGKVMESPDCWEPDLDMVASMDGPLYHPATAVRSAEVATLHGS